MTKNVATHFKQFKSVTANQYFFRRTLYNCEDLTSLNLHGIWWKYQTNIITTKFKSRFVCFHHSSLQQSDSVYSMPFNMGKGDNSLIVIW